MATLYPDIKTNNWQISMVGVGYIAEGLADIRQCLDILLRTQKGSDPLRPEFGCDIFQYADKPLTYAIPNIVRAIIEAVSIWETRVRIKRIKYFIETGENAGQVRFEVICTLEDDELIDLILLYMNGGFIPVGSDIGSLTLYALFPPNPGGKRYNISFIGNDATILPLPPENGFEYIQDLFNWVVANWSAYGTWNLGSDRITLFVKNGLLQTGSLSMFLIGTLKFQAPIPNANIGEDYAFSFVPDVVQSVPDLPASFASPGEMLEWLQNNWSAYGTWAIEGNPYEGGDFDIQDFDVHDFDLGAPADYIIVLYTDVVNSCTMQVTIV